GNGADGSFTEDDRCPAIGGRSRALDGRTQDQRADRRRRAATRGRRLEHPRPVAGAGSLMALLTPAELHERAAAIRLAVFDVDGSLADGRLWFDADGRESKAFHVQDGLGLRLLEDHGIAVALITARASAAVLARARDLRLQRVFTGIAD